MLNLKHASGINPWGMFILNNDIIVLFAKGLCVLEESSDVEMKTGESMIRLF
jgi:hypothetical protein